MEKILSNNDAYQLINNVNKITLLTHYRPDGDGISACCALESFLEKLGKQVETVFPNNPEFQFKRTPKIVYINKHVITPELLIAVDTANYERLYYPKEFKNIPIINIDHHISNTIKGKYNFINANTSSTCEILFDLLKYWNKNLIDKYIAECLLFGILYDSMIFHTQSTYPATLRISAELMELGADLYKLKTELISDKDPKIINLWGKVLSNIQISKSGKAAWAKITQDDLKKNNLSIASLIGFNNFLSQISGVEYTLLFYQTESGQTKVSLRSKTEDVNKLALPFGGGGHKNAAGILSNEPIDSLIEKITSNL
ncbi:bifunctional oligoribonuclease/PAP phosphatase NrnA [Candidatus Dependentiae bacterium]|nr:bifunctional oligoribonuclease/PAP phosphatase NrnA [Candidatus Dependentiae bacterium]MBU4387368.1 bifunctional oligoribonuclease/PAP phosphatase NrnA [Candidatus Dependentiae bacterium]MCG2756063.1 bifunctional oligoribonuclease/PAP phosphatase NrnA [Candidatus Dependentiae bacterium]